MLGQLARVAALELHGPARRGAVGADLVVGDHGDRRVEDLVHPPLEQERDLDHGDREPGLEPVLPLRDAGADARVQDRLEPGQLVGVLEDDAGDPAPVEVSVLVGDPLAPALDQQRRDLIGGEQLVDDGVGGEGLGAELAEQPQRLGLARSDAAGQPDQCRA